MAEYTKGEWKRGGFEDKPFARSCLSIFREDGRRIAEISREGFMAMEEAEANAQLIASAPELYEACKRARASLSDIGRMGALTNAIDALDKAIAKVEGKDE